MPCSIGKLAFLLSLNHEVLVSLFKLSRVDHLIRSVRPFGANRLKVLHPVGLVIGSLHHPSVILWGPRVAFV